LRHCAAGIDDAVEAIDHDAAIRCARMRSAKRKWRLYGSAFAEAPNALLHLRVAGVGP
jgi:hypothetical protein